MKTTRKNHGPFISVRKAIKATLKHGPATLTCDVQRGTTIFGSPYKTSPRWWVKYDASPCAMGPWNKRAIREYFTA